jgi:hypothetical protein
MRLPEARRPSCISSRRAAAFARALSRVFLAAPALASVLLGSEPARSAVLPLGPDGGSLLCSGRSGRRTPRAALPDGTGGWLVVTRDPMTDPVNPPDGGDDIGLLHLDASLAPLPVNNDPGGDDPCGALLVGGAGNQTPFDAFAIAPGRFVVIGLEIALDHTAPGRVFATGFDGGGRPLFPGFIVTPADPLVRSNFPFGAPDGAGGFFFGWMEPAPNTPIVGRVLVARFDGTGQPLWPSPIVLSTTLLAYSSFSRAVADGSGGVFASWIEPFPGDPDGYQPRVQHLDAAGAATLPAGGVRIDPARRITDPAVLAPWRQTATAGVGSTSGGVIALAIAEVTRAHLILADGTRPWGATGRLVMPGQTGLQPNDVAFAAAPDGSIRVTWIETDGFMLDRLMARRLDPDGRMPWPEPVVMIETIGMLERSEVVMPDGTLMVAAAVTALDMPAAPGDIIAQAIDGRGRTKTAVAGFDVSRADRLQSNPILMPAAGGAAPLLWVDKRAGVGVDGADNYFSQSLAYTSAPRLAPPSFTPLLRQGRPIVVTIEGDDLAADLTATMCTGVEVLSVAVDPLQIDGPGDRLMITMRAAANAPLGPRALRIINPDGSAAEVPAVVNVTLDPARIDIDGSGRADGHDLVVLASSFGRAVGETGYATAADIDGSGLVDGLDLALLAARFGDRVEQ